MPKRCALTGKKEEQKSFMSFSGFVGGHKSESARSRRSRHPELIVERAVRGMIPHNKLGRAVYRKLKVYQRRRCIRMPRSSRPWSPCVD